MADQVKVTSVDALEWFRASLIVFLNKTHNCLDQVTDEIRRTRSWIQHDQRLHWEGEVRRRTRVLAQAEQELLSARMIKLLDNLSAQQAVVHKARRSLDEAAEKLRNVKLWSRDFDSSVEPLTKSLYGFRDHLLQDMPKGISYLVQAQKTLEAYNQMSRAQTTQVPSSDSAET